MSFKIKSRYQQVAFDLENILKEQYKPGDRLPSEFNLAKTFEVNRHTIRRAIDELVNVGLLKRHQGKRTEVINSIIQYPIQPQTMFSKSLINLGKSSSVTILSSTSIEASNEIAQHLNINEGDRVFKIETLRTVDNQIVCFIEHYLNAQLLPEIDSTYQTGSLHHWIESEYKFLLFRKKILMSAEVCNKVISKKMKYPINHALLVVKSINGVSELEQNIEYSIARSRPDLIQYELNFNEANNES